MKLFLLSLLFIYTHLTIHGKNILVTGGAGFLGSHLCERKIQEGHNVYCLVKFAGSKENISHLLSHPNFTTIQADVTEPILIDVPLDEIYNFACPVYRKAFIDPIKTMMTNIMGAIFVLQLAERTGAKVFQASTAEIYGDSPKLPEQEKDWGYVNPIGVRACYVEGKRCAEALFFDYHRRHGVKIKVGRVYHTYGPRMGKNSGSMLSNFINQALNDEPITIFGKGDQTRTLCYVNDLIDAICTFMNTPDEITGPINLGDTHEYTVSEIATKVIFLTDSRSPIVYAPLRQDDSQRRCPDISLAQEILHWSPRTPINQGLAETISYFKKLSSNSM